MVYVFTHVLRFPDNTIIAWTIDNYHEQGNIIITILLLPLGHISNSLTDKDLRRICGSQYEHPGSAIGYWPETCLGHVYIVLAPVGSACLTFGDNQYYEFMCFDVPKIVRSPGCDHGHDEESRNGRDIKIDILTIFGLRKGSEWFGYFSKYRRVTGIRRGVYGPYWAIRE